MKIIIEGSAEEINTLLLKLKDTPKKASKSEAICPTIDVAEMAERVKKMVTSQ